MSSDPEVVAPWIARIVGEVQSWSGIAVDTHPDAIDLRLGRGVLARIHSDGLFEIPFPKPVRDELIAARRAEPHPDLPQSGWVRFRLLRESEIPRALELLALSYEPRRPGTAPPRRTAIADDSGSVSGIDPIDESIQESFPASDPPAVGHE